MPLGSTITINLLKKGVIDMNKHLSIFNQLRPVTVGFDNIFDHFESMFDNDVFNIPQVNYPPYNIVKTGDFTYDVELALAGYSKEDITVDYADNLLTVKSLLSLKSLLRLFIHIFSLSVALDAANISSTVLASCSTLAAACMSRTV